VKGAPWALIVDGRGNVTERKLQDQSPGDQLARQSVTVSNTVRGGQRTVVLTRAMAGKSADYYSFVAGDEIVVPFINAVGSGPDLAHHKLKDASSLALLPVGAAEQPHSHAFNSLRNFNCQNSVN
jgi:hypothetical protein